MNIIRPGSTVGVLGSGQLGRMFAIAARQMGYRVHTFSPDTDTPTGQIADVEITAPYEDLDAVRNFARNVSVLTFEFENIPSETVAAASEFVPVRPGGHVLHVSQQRVREKEFLTNAGLPVTPFAPVSSLDELREALVKLGTPAILKTAEFGYDGKGQHRIGEPGEALSVWEAVQGNAILEAFISFECELSVVAARSASGEFAHFGAIENIHRRHILDLSLSPARVPVDVTRRAVELTRAVFEVLDVVGVLCVEFFVKQDGTLLINELAPRPHNSGHLTVDACVSSQFEQQLRAVCGLPLGATAQLRPAVMANLLGELWRKGEPRWERALESSRVKLHLYGKLEPRPGRKMGHLTALAGSVNEALDLAVAARGAL